MNIPHTLSQQQYSDQVYCPSHDIFRPTRSATFNSAGLFLKLSITNQNNWSFGMLWFAPGRLLFYLRNKQRWAVTSYYSN